MQLIDGKAVADRIKQEIAQEVEYICSAGGKQPHLAAVLVGHDGGSETYVAHKVKACEQCGFKSTLVRYESDVTEEELLNKVNELNNDPDIDGFIVQLPLPKHISEQKVIEAIDYRKDVDGFHPVNVGRMSIGLPCFVSGYTRRNHGVACPLRNRDQRKTLCGTGTKQHCWQTGSYTHDAKGLSGQCHGNRMS